MAKKQLNKNIVVVITLSGFALMLVAAVLILRDLERRDPAYFVAQAEKLSERGEWEQAAAFYQRAYERGNDPNYLVKRGDMALNLGNTTVAYFSWREALVANPALISAHTRQVDLVLELARLVGGMDAWDRVQKVSDALLEQADKQAPDEALARHARGLALIRQTSKDETYAARGLSELEQATVLSPKGVDYHVSLADEYVRLGRTEDAEGVFTQLLDAYPIKGIESSKLRRAYARFLGSQGRLEEAERFFKESVEFGEDYPDALLEAHLAYAGFLVQAWAHETRANPGSARATSLFDEAESLLNRYVLADVEAFEPYQKLAILYKAAKRYTDAIAVCESRLSRPFSSEGIQGERNKMGVFHLNLLAAEACLPQVVGKDPKDRDALLDTAEQYVIDARGEKPGHPNVMVLSARIKLARGLDREGLADLRLADEVFARYGAVDWDSKILMAQVYLQLGEAGTARQVLEAVLAAAIARGSRSVHYFVVYTQVLIQSGALDAALDICKKIDQLEPGNPEARRLRAAIYERQGRPGEAATAMGDEAPMARAILRYRELKAAGDHAQAMAVLRDALELYPADLRLVRTAVLELVNSVNTEEAMGVVEAALAVSPDDPQLRALALSLDPKLTPAARDEELLKIINSEGDAYKRNLDLTDFYSSRDKFVSALTAVIEAESHLLAKDTPLARKAQPAHHLAILKTKLYLASRAKNEDAMRAARESALVHDLDGVGGKSVLGLFHIYREEWDLAERAFRDVINEQATNARALAFLGQCAHQRGGLADAQSYYEGAIAANPNEGMAHRGLALLALRRGDKAVYQEELSHCQRLIPNDTWVKRQVEANLEQADPDAAIAKREKDLIAHPEDTANLRRLAGLCEIIGNLEKADRYGDRLLELSRDDRETVGAACKYYRRTNRPERSLALANQFVESRMTPVDKAAAMMVVAAHHLSLKDMARAESALLAAAEVAETLEVTRALAEFNWRAISRVGDALMWQDKAIALAKASGSPQTADLESQRIGFVLHPAIDDTALARTYATQFRSDYPEDPRGIRWEATVSAREGKLDEAVGLLTAYLEERPNDLSALWERARYYLSQGHTVKAIADLETIRSSSSPTWQLEARLLLAQIHRRAGRREAWLRELESLVKVMPRSELAQYKLAQAYIEEKRFSEADRLITTWINSAEGTDPSWYSLRGQISLGLEESDKAIADFERYAEASGYTTRAVATVLSVYLQLDRANAAVRFYADHAPVSVKDAVLAARYAHVLAKAGRSDEAIAHFRQAMKLVIHSQPDAVGSVTSDLRMAFEPQPALELLSVPPAEATLSRANDRLLVQLHLIAGRWEQAAQLLVELIKTAASDAERAVLYHELGNTLLGRQPERARDALEEALRLDDQNWLTLNNLAYVLSEELNLDALALPYARRAVEMADHAGSMARLPSALDTLGWIHARLGNDQEAVAQLSRAVRLDPGSALVHYHLGETHRRAERYTKAKDILDIGLTLARSGADETLAGLIATALRKVEQRDAKP